jgi:catechol 2,3-dioxygenase-like lactoylglutathione lyase family enzyme
MIKSLAHVCMQSKDIEKTEAFYCGVLGLQKVFDFTWQGKRNGFYMKTANETFIEVFQIGDVGWTDRQSLHHFCLETDALADLHRDLIARGYEPGPMKLGADRTSQFWMKDPGGFDVEFQEYRADSSHRTGGAVEVNWQTDSIAGLLRRLGRKIFYFRRRVL